MAYLLEQVKTYRQQDRNPVDDDAAYWLGDSQGPSPRSSTSVLLEVEYHPPSDPPVLPTAMQGLITEAEWSDPEGSPPQLGSVSSGMTPADPVEPDSAKRIYDSLLPQWLTWAEHERGTRAKRAVYDRLERLEREASQRIDTDELVLGAGLISSCVEGRWMIRRHLLIWSAKIARDPETDALRVVVPVDQRVRIEHQDFLTADDGYRASRGRLPWSDTDTTGLHPFSPQLSRWLEEWKRRFWNRPLQLATDQREPPALIEGDETRLTLAPALFLRPRDRSGLERFYSAIADSLDGQDSPAPLGLAQLVTSIEPEHRLAMLKNEGRGDRPSVSGDPLFPLASNREQRRVLEKLNADTTVVVQGPPGTGKTHTIANLICALLADGQRLLITSQKDQALRVLRDQLPPAVRQLCVLMTGTQRSAGDEPERSITALSDLTATVSTDELRRDIAHLRVRRNELVAALAQAVRDLRSVREQEYLTHPPVAPGYTGTLARLVQLIAAGRDRYSWIDPLPAGAAAGVPLSGGEARELWHLLTSATPARVARAGQRIPGADLVPPAADVAAMLDKISRAERILGPYHTSSRWVMATLDDATLADIERHVDAAADALATCGLPDLISDWGPSDWRRSAADALLARRSPAYWHALFMELRDVEPHVGALAALSSSEIDLGSTPLTTANLTRLAGQAKRLRSHFSRGGRLRRYLPARAQVNAADLLEVCTVDGAPPATARDLAALITVLKAEAAVTAALEAWASVGAPVVPGPLRRRVAHLNDVSQTAAALRSLTAARDAIEQVLRRHGVRYAVRSPEDWDLLVRVARGRSVIAGARHATETLSRTIDALHSWSVQADSAPEVAKVAAALRHRDVGHYIDARAALDRARDDKCAQDRCDGFYRRLADVHPTLAQQLTDSLSDPTWGQRLDDIEAAWAWGAAVTYHRLVREPGADRDHEQRIDDVETQLSTTTAELVGKQALLQCLTRMTERQRQALQAYRNHMGSLGRGKVKSKDRYLAAAREAMQDAQQAVPAWVMPLAAVTDTIPPQPNAFDVVIVDEASQASIDALFLLWLAPRVIVVGDDKQCAPGLRSHNELKTIEESLDRHLSEMPLSRRNGFSPTSNLYELLSTHFPDVIRLSEHFRSMPEIIGWSSAQFYDNRLIPLRQFGADRLDPLKVIHVEGATEIGRNFTLRNQAEAETVIDHVKKIIDDPMYRNKSIGIIALQGGKQVQILDKLLNERIDSTEIRRRRIRVGQPPEFQGDERDIVMLSMVVTKAKRALTSRTEQRRYNVAATRARDQLWLFTSVPVNSLNPTDLRHSLLTYMMHPPATLSIDPDLDDITADIRAEPFDSLLQQRVFLELRRRGYAVVPQYPVDHRTIDLVVVGDNGRLAVECDTPSRPLQPDQVEQETPPRTRAAPSRLAVHPHPRQRVPA
ncbi:AAA domain-containing protein [Solwaraspora sp. WMMD1047]|uniref:AAA domain-containing protein n=1 Tax=Solwaraspora sp. WMMD1047 TaxID=3016102 RepID=UPI0024174AAC|nr:AAA domain-containing protein [Solwaraspora sp. WMMD1047]MDG4830020.1 AAA domain-containing protein [Solwaraspora sp. WMMD1047]